MDKINLFKQHKADYATPKKPTLVETTPGCYLVAAGEGPPGGPAFEDAVGALYGIAYTLKFMAKDAGHDFVVCKLEAIWWTTSGAAPSDAVPDDWRWEMMIRVPEFVTGDQLGEARTKLREKGKSGPFDDVRLVTLHEGPCVQVLHVGPYENEEATIETMRDYMTEHDLDPAGHHHEIYLSDPRRVPAEKLRTILRQPVASRG